MAAIAAAEVATSGNLLKGATAKSARFGTSHQLEKSANFRTKQNGYGKTLDDIGHIANMPQVVCDICLFGEAAGSRKAKRMVPCPSCKRHYHRSCLKCWASNRDLFNWASWVCSFCRFCEVCRQTGEPNKLMFCKRCDRAYHSYCQQPQLKHVPKGSFLCPRHVSCHSCSSRIPGSGSSSRWFLGYTNCDACGRLFVKGKYCPVCLKVYRDSEASPMVCCDGCEHWVHCHCDGISDEKYRQFQLDYNLQYHCPACRGDCHKVKDLDDATIEIWRIKDDSERDLISQYQASAGIPSGEKALELCPSSDDEENNILSFQVEDSAKEIVKQEVLLGKLRKGNASRKLVPLKKGQDKKDTFESGKNIEATEMGQNVNKFKIILPKPAKHILKVLSTRDSRIEKNGSYEGGFNQKLQERRRVVGLLEQASPVIEAINETPSDKGNSADSSPSEHTLSRRKGVMLVGGFSSGRAQINAGKRSTFEQEHEDCCNIISRTTTPLDINSNDTKCTKIILHVPSPDKEKKGKGSMNVPFTEMIGNDNSKESSADYVSDNDAGIDTQILHQHEDASVNEMGSVSCCLQKTHHKQPTKMQIYNLNPGDVMLQGLSKHHDMSDNEWRPIEICRDANSGAKGYTFMPSKVDAIDISVQPCENDSVWQKHYDRTGEPGREDIGRCERYVNDTSVSSHSEGNVVPGQMQTRDLEYRPATEPMNSSPVVSLKLKLKKPIIDVHGCGSNGGNERTQHEPVWGRTSKRKRYSPPDVEILQ